MSDEKTIHNGGGTQRGLYIALAVIAVFVLGMAMLGSGSAPQVGEETGTATVSD